MICAAFYRALGGRKAAPTAGIIDSRTLHGGIENGERGGYDANQKKKGSQLHMVVDVPGNLLAAHVRTERDIFGLPPGGFSS